AASARIVGLLGFTTGRTAVAQVLENASTFTDASDATATGSTALTDLKVSGAAAGLSAGDAIVITGTRGDGVAVSSTMTLSGSETVQSLLDRLNLSGMFGNASR